TEAPTPWRCRPPAPRQFPPRRRSRLPGRAKREHGASWRSPFAIRSGPGAASRERLRAPRALALREPRGSLLAWEIRQFQIPQGIRLWSISGAEGSGRRRAPKRKPLSDRTGVRASIRLGGAEGDRTPDLRNAIAALSQLSYCPVTRGRRSGRRISSTSARRGKPFLRSLHLGELGLLLRDLPRQVPDRLDEGIERLGKREFPVLDHLEDLGAEAREGLLLLPPEQGHVDLQLADLRGPDHRLAHLGESLLRPR